MSEYEWTCAGCGVPSPNKVRSCDCATNVVCWDRKHEWKRDASFEALPDPVKAEISRGETYGFPGYQIGLTYGDGYKAGLMAGYALTNEEL
jgi:hypothetical protein